MPEVLEILLLFIVHCYFVYSKSKWLGLFWKCQNFKEFLLLLSMWKNNKSINIWQKFVYIYIYLFIYLLKFKVTYQPMVLSLCVVVRPKVERKW
jgi:hypothetical protein